MTLALPSTTLDALRDELARTRALLAEYVGHEPTIREEMAHLRQVNDRLEATIGHLLINLLGTYERTVWTNDIDALTGGVLVTDENDHGQTTLRFIRWPKGGAR